MKDNFEEQKRKKLYQEMKKKKKEHQEVINESRKIGRKLQINARPNNIARVAFRKITSSIVPQFRKAGLNFYSKSAVSTVICQQLMAYVDEGQELLQEYNANLNLGKSNISQKGIREEAIKAAKQKLSEYEELDTKIENYSLRENIIDAIVSSLCPDKGLIQLGRSVPNLVSRDIAPILNKLGLGDLMPQLKQKLVEKYQKIEQGSGISPEVSIPYYGERLNANKSDDVNVTHTEEDEWEY